MGEHLHRHEGQPDDTNLIDLSSFPTPMVYRYNLGLPIIASTASAFYGGWGMHAERYQKSGETGTFVQELSKGRYLISTINGNVVRDALTRQPLDRGGVFNMLFEKTFGDNLLSAPEYEEWKRRNQLVLGGYNPAGGGGRTQDLVVQVLGEKKNLIDDAMNSDGFVEPNPKIFINSIVGLLCGESSEEFVDAMVDAIDKARDYAKTVILGSPVSEALDNRFIGFDESKQHVFGLINEMIERNNARPAGSPNTALDHLQAHVSDPEVQFTIDDLYREVFLMFVAGSSTSFDASNAAITYLSRHGEIQSEIRKQLREVLKPNEFPTYEKIKDLGLLIGAFNEGVRMLPPTPTIQRKLRNPIIIGNLTLPPGTFFEVQSHMFNHNPNNFPLPDEYRPSRFIKGDKYYDWPNNSRITWGNVPGQNGRTSRGCAGEPTARAAGTANLAYIMRNYELEAVSDNLPSVISGLFDNRFDHRDPNFRIEAHRVNY